MNVERLDGGDVLENFLFDFKRTVLEVGDNGSGFGHGLRGN